MRFGQREHGERFADGVKNFDRITWFDVRRRSGMMFNNGGHGATANSFRRQIDGERDLAIELEFHEVDQPWNSPLGDTKGTR